MKKIILLIGLNLLVLFSSYAQYKHSKTSIFKSYTGLVMTGYQGWFNAPDDGAGRGWNHFVGRGQLADGNCKFDLWPDTREYAKTYNSTFNLPDGSPAKLFSAYDASTQDIHFKWMKQYGIDGVFMQRFVSNLKNEKSLNHNNVVLENALKASEKYGRAISVMYDLSGMQPGDAKVIIEDWKYLVNKVKLTSRGNKQTYLYHNGKPLVALWGVGFAGRKYGLKDIQPVIDFLKNDPKYGGCSILLGVPTRWRELKNDADSDSSLLTLLKQIDIVQPWFVGRFKESNVADMFALIQKDMAWCTANNVDYVPVIYPGFSWHNMYNNSPQNLIPRDRGNFFWEQLSGTIKAGVSMVYIAMFDEIDEGTAIFKISKNPPVGKSLFVTFEDDIPEDYYLYLAGYASKVLKKQLPMPPSIPLPLKVKK